jgi:tRNA threonylcarbamoyladenosine modification (KEOPS) complex  Pcc1 subunit
MRTGTVETTHDDAAAIAAAIAPDNTSEMATTVDGDRVVTRIERETTSGLQSTVDDYVVNVDVAERVVQTANQQTTHNT